MYTLLSFTNKCLYKITCLLLPMHKHTTQFERGSSSSDCSTYPTLVNPGLTKWINETLYIHYSRLENQDYVKADYPLVF